MPGLKNIVFETPFALLLLTIIPLLVAVHYFQRKRVLIKASTFFIWNEIFEELKPKNTWTQIFRNILLLLHVLFIIFVSLSAANPRLNMVDFSGERIVLLIDNSASMNTLESGKTRLEQAKKAASSFILSQGGSKKFMVIPVVSNVTTTSFITDKAAVSALSSINPTDAVENITSIVDEIYSVQKNSPAIYYFGDANTDATKKALKKVSDIVIVPIGEAHENLGIVNLSSRFIPQLNKKCEVRIVVKNFGSHLKKSILDVSINEKLILHKELSLSAEESKSFTSKLLPKSSGILKAILKGNDSYMQDNVAYSFVPGFSHMKAVLVSDSYPAKLLKSIRVQKNIDINLLSTHDFIKQYLVKPKKSDNVIGIFYKFLPERTPFGANIYIDTLRTHKTYNNSNNMIWSTSHPIAKNLYFNNFFIPSFSSTTTENTHAILQSGKDKLIFSGDSGRNLFFAFDTELEGFSTQPSFPLLIRRVFLWFKTPVKRNIKAMDIFSMPVSNSDTIQVFNPKGQNIPFKILNGNLSIVDTFNAGVYKIKTNKHETNFVVKQHNEESSISPLMPGKAYASKRIIQKDMLSIQEPFMAYWKLFSIIALILLICEWWYQKKGIYALY